MICSHAASWRPCRWVAECWQIPRPSISGVMFPGCRLPEGLHPIGLAAAGARGEADADVPKPGIHDVFAMAGAVEPARYDFFRRLRTQRDVLACQTRLIAGATHTVPGLAAVTAPMFEIVLSRHVARVFRGCFVQCARCAQRWRGDELIGAALSIPAACDVHQLEHTGANGAVR